MICCVTPHFASPSRRAPASQHVAATLSSHGDWYNSICIRVCACVYIYIYIYIHMNNTCMYIHVLCYIILHHIISYIRLARVFAWVQWATEVSSTCDIIRHHTALQHISTCLRLLYVACPAGWAARGPNGAWARSCPLETPRGRAPQDA